MFGLYSGLGFGEEKRPISTLCPATGWLTGTRHMAPFRILVRFLPVSRGLEHFGANRDPSGGLLTSSDWEVTNGSDSAPARSGLEPFDIEL